MAGRRIGEPICLTTMVLAMCRSPYASRLRPGSASRPAPRPLGQDVGHLLAAALRDLSGALPSSGPRGWRGSCCRGSASRSTWRPRPDAEHLEHGAHRTAGDDPGAFRRGAHDHLAGAVTALDVVVQGAAFRSGTRIIWRLACSVALRIASGTSLALPLPKPTRPFWSPTTTSAAKPKRLPPFTVLDTRLIATRRSANSGFRRGRGGRDAGRGGHVLPSGSPFLGGAHLAPVVGQTDPWWCDGPGSSRAARILGMRRSGCPPRPQNFRPPSRAASASALTLPWNRKPPRSK
jgi:hypothetical protein